MIVMAAQSRLLNPLEPLQGPEPALACVTERLASRAPGRCGGSPLPLGAAAQSPSRRRVERLPGARPVPVSRGLWSRLPSVPSRVSSEACGHCAAMGSE